MKALEWYKLDQLLAEHLTQMGMEQLQKNVAHLLFEIGALRRELAIKGLAKESAHRRALSPGLADRLYSKPQPASSVSTSGRKAQTKQSLFIGKGTKRTFAFSARAAGSRRKS